MTESGLLDKCPDVRPGIRQGLLATPWILDADVTVKPLLWASRRRQSWLQPANAGENNVTPDLLHE